MNNSIQQFQWTGIDKAGKHAHGVTEAVDIKDAQLELSKMGVEVITLKSKRKSGLVLTRAKVKTKNILLFTRYLSTMLSAGLPILQALEVISQDQENIKLQSFVVTLRNNVAGGKTLAETFSQYPDYFGTMYCNLIKAGEKSGTLDNILKRLGTYLERTESLKAKVKKALTYPVAILSVAFIVSTILLIFVVPKFKTLFDSFGAQLPLFTRIVLNISNFMQSYWWLVGLALFGAFSGFRYAKKNYESVQYRVDSLMLRMMIIGPILRKSIIARFTRTLATTLDAGMPIAESLRSMAPIMGNLLYSKAVLQICDDVVSGHQLNVAMANAKLFPNMVVQMVAVGEISGSLTEMLNKVADYYEEDVNNSVDNLSSLLEPIIMLVLGVVIGSLIIAMYLPIFKLGSLF